MMKFNPFQSNPILNECTNAASQLNQTASVLLNAAEFITSHAGRKNGTASKGDPTRLRGTVLDTTIAATLSRVGDVPDFTRQLQVPAQLGTNSATNAVVLIISVRYATDPSKREKWSSGESNYNFAITFVMNLNSIK